MSKIFKQLIYDTDWISQPGDPLTSPNGQVSVKANNDGTATLQTTSPAKTVLAYMEGTAGVTYRVTFQSQHSVEELCSGEVESVSATLTITISPQQVETHEGTWLQLAPGASVYYLDGCEWKFNLTSTYGEIFGDQTGCTATYTTTTVPASTTTETLATEDYVDDKIGNINAILDEINGEVI